METMTLDGMTWDVCKNLPESKRAALRSAEGLSPQLTGLEGYRAEVVTTYGKTRRFIVSRSTGWNPCHIEVKTIRSLGGTGAESKYESVRVIRRVR